VPKIVEVEVPYEKIVYVETPVEKTVYKEVQVPQYLSNEFVRTKVIFVCDLLASGYS
jgi:hypothetical protein